MHNHATLIAMVDALFADSAALIDAVRADGWPAAMAREGFELHRQTWEPEAVIEALRQELAALDDAFIAPRSIAHIWPALPGAGLTPMLFGVLLGADQIICPSRRGLHFARYVSDRTGVRLETSQSSWQAADVVVVSGSDETIEAVRRAAPDDVHVTGYGHRVSFAVVVDDPDLDLQEIATKLAIDIVLWHQQGCFSARAVVFCGTRARSHELAAALSLAVAHTEHRLEATELPAGALAERAQAMGVAQFLTGSEGIWSDGIGFVHATDRPFTGAQLAAHSVTLHRIDTLQALPAAVQVPRHQLQGVALACASTSLHSQWSAHLTDIGATRICPPGRLQCPPASWPHDGRPNVLEWLKGRGQGWSADF